jgi:hypothetical protein
MPRKPKESTMPDLYDGNGETGGESMDECICKLLTGRLGDSGQIAQNNFITLQKVVDYDYLENKRIVTLDEAIGVREVSSKVVPAGPQSYAGTTA